MPAAYSSALWRGLEAFGIVLTVTATPAFLTLGSELQNCSAVTPVMPCSVHWVAFLYALGYATVVGVIKTALQFGENVHNSIPSTVTTTTVEPVAVTGAVVTTPKQETSLHG